MIPVSAFEPFTADDVEDKTLEALMDAFIAENGLNENNFSIYYYNTVTGEEYCFNENTMMDAASTYKLPLNMYFYEKEAAGEISGNDYLPYSGTTLANCHMQSIVCSNNPLSQAMRKNLGSYYQYKTQMRQYTDMPEEDIDPIFYMRNSYCTRIMMDILKYLYERQDIFSELISYMKEAMPGAYFKKYIDDCEIAHKYGSNEGFENDVGIIYADQPFLLAVYTRYVGAEITSQAAQLLKTYTDGQYKIAVAEEEARLEEERRKEEEKNTRIAAENAAAEVEEVRTDLTADRIESKQMRTAETRKLAQEERQMRIQAQVEAVQKAHHRRMVIIAIGGCSAAILGIIVVVQHAKKRRNRITQ